jgi:hypothetical protein
MENLEAARAKRRQEVRAALVAADPSYVNNPPVGADANPTFTNVASGTHNAASSTVSSGSLTQDARIPNVSGTLNAIATTASVDMSREANISAIPNNATQRGAVANSHDVVVDANFSNTHGGEELQGEQEPKLSMYASSYYHRNNNKLKVLIPMVIGLKDSNGKELFDADQLPWSSKYLKVNDWRPKNDHLNQEVTRRYQAYGFSSHIKREPQTKRWKKPDATDWLLKHPIDWKDDGVTDAALDVAFVREEIGRRVAELMKFIEESDAQKDALEGRWSGNEPMLRLIHCMIDFEYIRDRFVHRNDSMDRNTLENRNSTEKRDSTCWELMSDKWNDPEFNPHTIVFNTEGQCDELQQEKSLDYSSVKHFAPATPEKCKVKMSEMMVALKRNIQRWESSGQGEGGNNNDEEYIISTPHETGSLVNRSRHALANRSSFFRYSEMYLLYFWDVTEKFDLTRSCMQVLKEDIAAGDGGSGVPSVFDVDDNSFDDCDGSVASSKASSKKGGKSQKTMSDSTEIAKVAASLDGFRDRSIKMQELENLQKEKDREHATQERIKSEYHASRERLAAELDSLQRDKRQYEWQFVVHKSKRQSLDDLDPTADAMQQFIDSITEEVDSKRKAIELLDEEMKSTEHMNPTPRKNNRTPL